MESLYNKILEAQKLLDGSIYKTPLIFSEFLSREYNHNVFIKPENLQRTGAFKLRGALNKIKNLSDEDKVRGLVASSAGNHAQGVALASKECNINATIVMPETTPLIKVDGTKSLGAEVILKGNNYDEAYAHAKKIEKEMNSIFIHPFDDLDIIAGQGTIGLEILNELPNADIIIVPIGGGGLISGIAAAAKHIKPEIKIIGVEPVGAACMKDSIEDGEICKLSSVDTIADGVAVKKPGVETFRIVNRYVDDIITVDDSEIMEALLFLIEKQKIISEAAGAVSVAAINKISGNNKNIVCLVSGGNIDVLTISEMLNKGLVTRGRIFCFSVELNHKPGVLLKVAKILADHKANVIKLDHNQFKTMNRFKNVTLEVTVETNGHDHINEITEGLLKGGYKVERVY